jgi:hypothetical protein
MNAKMKVLALALLGLAGYAGSAVAGCPSSPVPPWSAAPALGGTVAIVAGGLDGSACRLDSTLTGDATSFATVEDDTPSAESRYRASFMINADSLTSLGVVDAAFVFTASAAAGGTPAALSIVGDGAGGHLVSYNIPDSTASGGADVGSFPLTAGANHVEIDVDNGSVSGTPHFSIWVNSNTEASPSFTTSSFNNGGLVVDTAFLGMAGPTPGYVSSSNGIAVGFDTFDSRRSTFIGY